MKKQILPIPIFLLSFLFSISLFSNDPCTAYFYDFGKGLRDTVPCGNGANTTSNIVVESAGTSSFNLMENCGPVLSAPNDYVAWFTFIIQGGGSSFEWQVIETGTDNVIYELYYSNDPMGPNECTDLNYMECGTGFNSWELIGVPNPNLPTRYYIAIYTENPDDDVDVNLKFRKACGEACANSDLSVDAGADVTIKKEENSVLSPTLSGGGGGPYSYIWTPNDGSIDDVNSPNPTVSPTETTTYYVSVNGADGCPAFDSVTVTVISLEECLQVLTLTCPDDFLGCSDSSIDPIDIGTATAILLSDKCPDYTVDFTDKTIKSGTCGDSTIIIRTWKASFDSDPTMFEECSQRIVLIDDEMPEINCVPNALNMRCLGDLTSTNTGDLWNTANIDLLKTCATDNCSAITVTSDFDYANFVSACGNTGILEAIYTVSDACGNSTTIPGKIIVIDETPPTLEDAPADITLAICSVIPVAATLTATDNCVGPVIPTVNDVRIDGTCADSYTIKRTWTATDACGNESTATQTITVIDTEKEVLSEAPANVTVSCDNIPAAAVLIAADNCNTDVEVNATEVRTDGTCANNYTLTRTWVYTNDCGFSESKSQTITVEDTTLPSIADCASNVAASGEVLCRGFAANLAYLNTTTAAHVERLKDCATDNCGAVTVTVDYDIANLVATCGEAGIVAILYSITDDCGNITNISSTLGFIDNAAPALSSKPDDITVECDNVPVMEVLTATDACLATTIEVTTNEVRTDGTCADNYTLTRTWTATDGCGNTTTHTQIITVQDNTKPVLANVPADATVECDAVPAAATNVTASDNCDNDVTITFAETRADGTCADAYTLSRVWTATDNCGNQISATQTITVSDNTKPVLANVPADATVECDAVPAAATDVTATDNCDNDVTITFAETRTDGACSDAYTLSRVWTATDNCGNQISATQTITVSDNTKPVLANVPADVTVECDAVPAAATNVTASDNCDNDVTITFAETRADGACSDAYTLSRVWTATDNCGNQISATQTITVSDNTKPVLANVPADATVECDAVPAAATDVTASDNCDNDVEITFAETRTDGACSDAYTLSRVWTATDNCGNQISATQTITVSDNTKPVLANIPADATVECDAVPAAATDVTASDNCDNDVEITFAETRADGTCADAYTLSRVWTATDNCGNQISATQTITVSDNTKPVLANVPADATVECDAVPAAATNVTATDNCDNDVEITFAETRADGTCANAYTLSRVWTATDNCSNQISATQTITVSDNTKPVLANIPADATVECDAIPAAATDVTASDNCDNDVEITFAETRTDGTCADAYTLSRVWTATDNCGNQISATQTITVSDNTKPVLANIPADATVECDAVPAAATDVTATDNCDNDVEISFAETRTDGACSDAYTLSRVWTATDNCGNQISATQTITVKDNTKPVLANVPANATVECDAVPAAATNVTASDNCDNDVTITFAETRADGTCADAYTLSRVWTATDNCGNQISATQTITVKDNTKPVLANVPADATVECDAVPAAATDVTASDNCDNDVEITFAETRTDGACSDAYTLSRVWTATDNCGNQISATQTITVSDNTKPVLANIPADATVECDAIPAAATDVTASDNCDNDVTITFAETRADGACSAAYTLSRVWTATDNCGNQISATQTIKVEDTTLPSIADCASNVAASGEVLCQGFAANLAYLNTTTAAHVERLKDCATDNCGAVTVTVDYDIANLVATCGEAGIVEILYSITDDCGNITNISSTLGFIDNAAPALSSKPDDITVECDNIPAMEVLTATDACLATTIEVTTNEVRTDGTCADNYTLTRTWTATDGCGNVATHSQVITVSDKTKPVLSNIPADATVECDAVPAAATDVTATDNCDNDVTIAFAETRTDGACADAYTLSRVWTATDNCGNQISATQIVTVQDVTKPVIECPADITVSCNEIPAVSLPKVTDNCTSSITPFLLGEKYSECEEATGLYTITRTWQATDNCGNMAECEQVITVDTKTRNGCYSLMVEVTYDPIDNTTTYVWMVDAESCASALSNIIFELPTGTTAISPNDGATWTSPNSGIPYTIENTGRNNDKTFSGIKFETNGEGIKNDKEIFTYTITGTPIENVKVEIKAGQEVTDFEVNTTDCGCIIIRDISTGPDCIKDIVVECDAENGSTKVSWDPIDAGNYCSKCPANVTEVAGFMFMGERGGHLYYCSKEKDVWQNAKTIAENMGGHLAVINNPAENDFLASFLENQYAHIGLTDEGQEGKFRWVNGDVLDYTNWRMTQPNNADNLQHYGQLLNDGTWNDNFATDSLEFIVEVPCVDIQQISGPLNGSQFSTGTATVTYAISDECGAKDTCSFTVTVEESLQVDCPDDIVIDCEDGADEMPVSWEMPSAYSCCDNCPPIGQAIEGFVYMGRYKGHQYYCSREKTIGSTAQQICESKGGYLAVINDATENEMLAGFLSSQNALIGLNDLQQEGQYQWFNGDPMTFINWYPGQPNNKEGRQDYVQLLPNGYWDDIYDDRPLEYILEIPCIDIQQIAGPANGSSFPAGTTKVAYAIEDKCGNKSTCEFDVTVNPCRQVDYCESSGQRTDFFWIRQVVLGSINNRTISNNGYGDYTDLVTDIQSNSQQTIILSPGFRRYYYYINWRVWIDYNQDGDFEDANEEILTYRTYNVLKAKFDVPGNYVPGKTRMRVSMKYGNPASSCEHFLYGEVEDYSINLLPSSNAQGLAESRQVSPPSIEEIEMLPKLPIRSLNLESIPLLNVYPNPVRKSLTVTLSDYPMTTAELKIYNNLGQIVHTQTIEPSTELQLLIDVQHLVDGLYFISIDNDKIPPLVQKFHKN